jgi:hypothetical protein
MTKATMQADVQDKKQVRRGLKTVKARSVNGPPKYD